MSDNGAGPARSIVTYHTMDRIIEKTLQVFTFFVPFTALGLQLGSYAFSVATAVLLVLNLLLLLRGRFLKIPLLLFVLFWFWCLFTAATRYDPQSYTLSLLGLGAMLFPLCASISDKVDGQSILTALVSGAVASMFLGTYEIGVNFGLPPLTDVISIGLWGTDAIQETSYADVYRIKAAETEPAHYALYLTFVYAIVDLAHRRGFRIPYPRALKILLFLFLLATMSLSGLVVFAAYEATALLLQWRETIYERLTSSRFWMTLPLVFVLSLGVWYYLGDNIVAYASFSFRRLDEAMTSLRLGLVEGSEASRARSATILYDYWTSQGWIGILMGEGYANYEPWLRSTFSYVDLGDNVAFARGGIHNVLSTIGISTGVVGLVLYVGFVAGVVKRRELAFPVSLLVAWVVYHFAGGFLIYHRLWWPLIIGVVLFRDGPDTNCGRLSPGSQFSARLESTGGSDRSFRDQ